MKNKKPEIRFKGFSEEWEEIELGKAGETFTGLSGKTKNDFGHGFGRFVTYMNVFSNSVSNPSMTEPIEIDKKQNEVKVGDVFFTTSSETIEEVGISSVWLGNTENVYLNSFCFGYRPTQKFDNYYLAYVLRSTVMRKKISFLGQGISRYNISKNKLLELTVSKPTLNEQTQIGNFFKNLDNLITLHQQKYDRLVNVKKGMLEKMFPKNGADAPEIRFKGFSGAWEEKKLGEVLTETKRSIVLEDNKTYELVTVKRRNQGVISRGLLKGKDILVKNYFEVREGDYIISKRQVIHGANGIIPQSLDRAIVSNEYLVCVENENITAEYLTIISNLPDMYKKFFLSSYGVDIEKLVFDVEDWKKRFIVIPSLTEQKRITGFFKNLDKLLTLHKGEIDKLKNLKKAMLEKMFV